MKKMLLSAAAVSLFLSGVTYAEMTEKQAKNAVEFRQSIFQLVKSNIGPLGAMAKGKAPINEEVIATNSLRLEQLGLMISDYFEADTRGAGVKSGALDKIWDNKDDFNSKANDLVVASKNLQKVVANKETGEYRKAIGKVGATCKACHDDYKAD